MLNSGVVSAAMLKLASSIDDVVWLTPFLRLADKRRVAIHILIYQCVCLTLSSVALLIAQGGSFMVTTLLLEQKEGFSPEKVLTLCAGIGLVIYGSILARDWSSSLSQRLWEATDDGNNINMSGDVDDDGESSVQPQQRILGEIEDEERAAGLPQQQQQQQRQQRQQQEEEEEAQGVRREDEKWHDSSVSEEGDGSKIKNQFTIRSLLVVAFVGSLDTLALFVPMIVGQAVDWVQLFVGTVLAASIITALSLFLGMCTPLSSLCDFVPLFVIVLAYGFIVLLKGLAMH